MKPRVRLATIERAWGRGRDIGMDGTESWFYGDFGDSRSVAARMGCRELRASDAVCLIRHKGREANFEPE